MEVLAEIRYDRQCEIGAAEGRNSRVFMVNDCQLGGQLVAKEVDKGRFGGDPAIYFEEARAMFAAAHQNVVPIRYACETSSSVVLAMPYYVRGSLGSRISRNPISAKELIRISQGILLGVSQIHTAGFVHFDIKPSNILFDNSDSPLVADFGQAVRILPSGGVVVPATYNWIVPPEVFTSGAGSFLCDIYQAGLLFYRAINGNLHYEDQFGTLDDSAIVDRTVRGKLPDRNGFLPHVPKRIRTIIRKALKVNPAERYQSAREFAIDLARVSASVDWVATLQPTGEARWTAKRPGMATLEVELIRSGRDWETRVWTVNGTIRRAKDPSSLCRSRLCRADAGKHLNEVFEKLA
jgi:serine/threonine protein kinase